jgi:U3 small nucleolar RNA-associated protein 21
MAASRTFGDSKRVLCNHVCSASAVTFRQPMAVVAADEEAIHPPSKRIRSSEKTGVSTNAGTPSKSLDSQRLFAPFRALGIITNEVPFALQLRAVKGSAESPRVHILTCLGNSWALWEGEKMTLLFVGE